MVRWCIFGSVVGSFAIGIACSSSTSGPPKSEPASSAQSGESLVDSYGCKNCHGNDMSGQTTPIALSTPIPCVELYPPNLTPDMTTGVGSWTDDQLQLAIISGVDNEGMSLCPEMKHYKDAAVSDVADMIAYLRALPAVVKTVPGSICPPLKGECDGGS